MKTISVSSFNATTNYNLNQAYFAKTKNAFKYTQADSADHTIFKGNLICSSEVGSYIKNIGLIIGEPKVFNKETNKYENCYLVYQNSELDGVFRLIKKDLNKIKDLSNQLESHPDIMTILKKYNFYTLDAILKKINPINAKVADLYDELRISEVGYTTITKERGRQIVIDKGYKCRPNSDIIFIEGFIVEQKKYSKASRLVASPLLKALQCNGDKDIVIVALPISENSPSPVKLYLSMGFKPLTESLQELESHKIHTPQGDIFDPKYKVSMYLPEDAIAYDIIKEDPILDEIYLIKPNWFKRSKVES